MENHRLVFSDNAYTLDNMFPGFAELVIRPPNFAPMIPSNPLARIRICATPVHFDLDNFGYGGDEGRTIGKLVVSTKEIGKGSNGTVVFEGTHEGRPVAVKRLVRSHYDVAVKEIENLIASDQHANIVRWYGREEDTDFIYLALELCSCNLYDLIKDKLYSESFQLWKPSGYPSSVLLNIMRDMVSGVIHLHELGIIHRDLKPHNVLIVKGNDLCAKLSDMGLSRRVVEGNSSLGAIATVSGTSGWRAPEQICHGRQTQAMDLFSLGCVFYFCMSGGEHPFGDDWEREQNVINNKVDCFLVKDIPEAEDLLSRLLNHKLELRPKASEVLHHPLFWNSETRVSFMRDASDRVELEDRVVNSVVLGPLESQGLVAFGSKWGFQIDRAFTSNSGTRKRYRWYNYDSVRDLLRLIRNTLNHYRELPVELQELLGSVPEGFDDYFRNKFPKLLMKVYNVVYIHCQEEEWFRKYLNN